MDFSNICALTILGAVFLGGIICNTLVIRGMYLIKCKKTPSFHNGKNDFINLLIINLAVADLLTLIVSLPTDVIADHMSWPFGVFVCKYLSSAQEITIPVSTLTFAAIAVERYVVSKGTPRRCPCFGKLFLFGTWFFSWLTIYLPFTIYKKIIVDVDREECDVVWPNMYVGRFFLFYIVALVIGCGVTGAFSYCGVRRNLKKIRKLSVKRRSLTTQDGIQMASFATQSVKISNMLFVLIALFMICTVPFLVFALLLELGFLDNFQFIYYTYIGTSCLVYCNSLANPTTVLIMNRECRYALCGKKLPLRKSGSERVV